MLLTVPEALDPQQPGGLEQPRQPGVLDGDLAAVHEVDDEPEVGVADAAEDDGGVVAGVGGEQLLEEAAAGRQQDLVALDGLAVGGGERRVNELLRNPAKLRFRLNTGRPKVHGFTICCLCPNHYKCWSNR